MDKLVFRFPSWTRWCDGFAMFCFIMAVLQLYLTNAPIYIIMIGLATAIMTICALGRTIFKTTIKAELIRRGQNLENVSFE